MGKSTTVSFMMGNYIKQGNEMNMSLFAYSFYIVIEEDVDVSIPPQFGCVKLGVHKQRELLPNVG